MGAAGPTPTVMLTCADTLRPRRAPRPRPSFPPSYFVLGHRVFATRDSRWLTCQRTAPLWRLLPRTAARRAPLGRRCRGWRSAMFSCCSLVQRAVRAPARNWGSCVFCFFLRNRFRGEARRQAAAVFLLDSYSYSVLSMSELFLFFVLETRFLLVYRGKKTAIGQIFFRVQRVLRMQCKNKIK